MEEKFQLFYLGLKGEKRFGMDLFESMPNTTEIMLKISQTYKSEFKIND